MITTVIASERRLSERRTAAGFSGAGRSVRRSERSNLRALRLLRPIFERCLAMALVLCSLHISFLQASEVFRETNSQVIVREHPKTGKPYVVITPAGVTSETVFFPSSKKFSRPNYRMLDPKVKSGQIPYDGPYSDSKRIYIFAATMATLGAGGLVGAAMLPATGTAAATGGAGYLAAGGVVAAGTTAAVVTASKPKTDEFIQSSKSESIDHR